MPYRTIAPRRTARSLPLAALLLSALLLAGCGGVEGKYSHQETTPEGETATLTLELKGDKKAVMTMTGSVLGGTLSVEGTYAVDGDKVAVTIDGDEEVFTRKGNKLVGAAFGDSVELVKQ